MSEIDLWLFIGGRMSYLYYLCLLAYSGVQHISWCAFCCCLSSSPVLCTIFARFTGLSIHDCPFGFNRIRGLMVSVLASSAVDCGFESQLGQTKDHKICISCFSGKQAAFRRKSKDWLARHQDNVSVWGDMSIHGLFFQWASTIKIQLNVLV